MLKPNLNDKSKNFIDNYFLLNYTKINEIIDKKIATIKFDNYLSVCFSTLFNQWIIANIIIERMLKKNPNIIFIAGGGCGTQKEAEALIRNFSHFKYVIWVEGEYALFQLTRYLDTSFDSKINIENIPNIVYRKNNMIAISNKSNVFVDINNNKYDYSDYFNK